MFMPPPRSTLFPYTTLFRSDRGGDVHHQDQGDGLLRGELHRLLGVDRGERHHRGDARLVKEDAQEEAPQIVIRSEEHTSELQSRPHLVCRLLLEKKKKIESE